MTTKTTPHGAALAAHAAAVAKTADMRRLLTEAQADADRLDAIPAVELLNRPEQVPAVAEARAKASQLVEVRRAVLAAAEAAEHDAARAAITTEADAMAPAIAAATKALTDWQAVEGGLLDKLEAHTGLRYVRPQREHAGYDGRPWYSQESATDGPLRQTVKRLESQRGALLAAADGVDPVDVCAADDLPDSLKPGGLLPSPRLVAQAAEKAARAAEEAAVEADMAAARARLAEVCAELGVDPVEPLWPGMRPAPDWVRDVWRRDHYPRATSRIKGATPEDSFVLRDRLATIVELAGPGVIETVVDALAAHTAAGAVELDQEVA